MPGFLTSKNIKRLRRRKQLTLQQLADRCELTKGYLSKIENSEKVPPFDTLQKIARGLGVGVSALVPEDRAVLSDPVACLTPSSEYGSVLDDDTPGPVVSSLADFKPGKNMMPFIWKFTRDITPMTPFKGEIMMHVISGAVQVIVGDKCFPLNTGDNLYFDADIHHSALAVNGAARVLVVKYFYKKEF